MATRRFGKVCLALSCVATVLHSACRTETGRQTRTPNANTAQQPAQAVPGAAQNDNSGPLVPQPGVNSNRPSGEANQNGAANQNGSDGMPPVANDNGSSTPPGPNDNGAPGGPLEFFALAIEVVGQGTVEITPAADAYERGAVVSLLAKPAPGWTFVGWSGDADGPTNPLAFTMDRNLALVATFTQSVPPSGGGAGGGGGGGGGNGPPTPPASVQLAVLVTGNGAVTAQPAGTPSAGGFDYPTGSVVTLTAVPQVNACFYHWGGAADSTDTIIQLTLTANTVASAFFAAADEPPPAPVLNPYQTLIAGASVTITGTASTCAGIPTVRVSSLQNVFPPFDVPVNGGVFTVDAPLFPNLVNEFVLATVSPAGVVGPPTIASVTRDVQAPSVFIDFPIAGAELTNATIDVAGRVSDTLSGFNGLSVTVNGVPAIVNIGVGTNGTFERSAVPLALGPNTITAAASDFLGNVATTQVTVTRVSIPPNAPQLAMISGNGQVGPIHGVLPQPIVVRVTKPDGSPFANKVVTFHVTRSDGRLGGAPFFDCVGDGTMTVQCHTDAEGVTGTYWQLGGDAGCGNNRVEVTSTSIVGTTFFCASALPGAPAQINVGSGNQQKAEAGGPAPKPLRVRLSDGCNGVSGVPITFTVVQGDGRVNDVNSVTLPTGPTGHAEVAFLLGPEPGNNVVEANFPGNPSQPAYFVISGVQREKNRATGFSGLIIDNASRPLGNVQCVVTVNGLPLPTAFTGVDGRFSFTGVPDGPAHLYIDGGTANTVAGQPVPPGSFPTLIFEFIMVPEIENSLPAPIKLPPLNPLNARFYSTSMDTELTIDGIDGLRMTVKAGSMRINGVPAVDGTLLALNQVHHDDVPMPMPDGAAPPFAWTLKPAGASFDPPIEITYPNMSGLPAGAVAYFLSFNHSTGRFEIVATGHVTDDGAAIETDPGVGLTIAGWGCNCPPYSVTGSCCHCPCQSCALGFCFGGGCDADNCFSCDAGANVCVSTCVDGNCGMCDGAGSCTSTCEGDCCNGSCCASGEICCGGSNCCDQLRQCQMCGAGGGCVDMCGPSEQCCNGSCCDGDQCQTCSGGSCSDTCDAMNCQMCDGSGNCVSMCDANQCQECDGAGMCISSCFEQVQCESCDGQGNCMPMCGENDCEVCDGNGMCISMCDEGACESCNGSGTCESDCDPDLCEQCDANGDCVEFCDSSDCEECDFQGNCVSICDATCGEVCNGAGGCTNPCGPNGCCDGNGNCNTCNPQNCEECFDGVCQSGCVSPCETCNNGVCQSTCNEAPPACETCVPGVGCLGPSCDCLDCAASCQTCVAGVGCTGGGCLPCEQCDGAGTCVDMCPLGQSCTAAGCQ